VDWVTDHPANTTLTLKVDSATTISQATFTLLVKRA
jgi:hypothetical protein